MKYPQWLPVEMQERFERASKAEPKNSWHHVLLMYNPNYEPVKREEMKAGEEYLFGRAITAGEHEGHIKWSHFKPQTQEQIDTKHSHFGWFAYRKKPSTKQIL